MQGCSTGLDTVRHGDQANVQAGTSNGGRGAAAVENAPHTYDDRDLRHEPTTSSIASRPRFADSKSTGASSRAAAATSFSVKRTADVASHKSDVAVPDQLRPPPAAVTSNDDFVVIDLKEDISTAAAAASTSNDTSSRLHAILQQLRPPFQPTAGPPLQRKSTNLSRCSSGSRSTQQLPGQYECRICLAADNPQDIVQPCSCSGTVQHAHMECLKAWVAERGSLQCELCGKEYKDGVRQQLEPLIDPRRIRQRQRQRSSSTVQVVGDGNTVVAIEGIEVDEEEPPRQQISWTRFWIHLGILLILLVAVLYLSLFVNVGSSDNFWLMFLWRAITVILPLFLIIRCVAALYTWRQQYVASRER